MINPPRKHFRPRTSSSLLVFTTLPTKYSLPLNKSLLQVLDLTGCRSLSVLPDTLWGLSELSSLILDSCYGLQTIPAGISELSLLELLDLSNWRLTALPEAVFAALGQLKVLKLTSCYSLNSLPDSIESLSRLQVRGLAERAGHIRALKFCPLSSPD